MQQKSTKKLWYIDVILASGKTKTVAVTAVDRETAERRALKKTPTGVDIQRILRTLGG